MVPTIYNPCRLEAEDAARCGLMVCDQGEWLYLAPDLRLTKILPTTRTKEGVCSLTLYQVSTQLCTISTISIYTVYLHYLYSLSTLYIAMKYFSKYCIYLYNGTDQTSVKGSLTVHWSNDPMNHFVALPHRTKINQLRKESNRNNIKTIQLPRIKIHVLNRSSEYKDVPTQFTETEMSGWKCDNSFKVPRRL